MNAYLNAMQRYVDFRGRSSRSQFWLFTLVLFGVLFVALLLDSILGTGNGVDEGIVVGVAYLTHLLPQLSVSARRLHDIDKSGWWLLIAFVPLVGAVVLLVFFCLPSTPGANRFGAGPGQTGNAQGLDERGAVAAPSKGNMSSSVDQLERLAALRASGALDDTEYQRIKAELLAART